MIALHCESYFLTACSTPIFTAKMKKSVTFHIDSKKTSEHNVLNTRKRPKRTPETLKKRKITQLLYINIRYDICYPPNGVHRPKSEDNEGDEDSDNNSLDDTIPVVEE